MTSNPGSASSHHGDDNKGGPSLSTAPSSSAPSRGRGRGKSRGGLGKYLRARGRGRGGAGRPAEFHKRLVLEDEELIEIDPESEEYKESQKKYSKRQLASNADRYNEPEPELNSDGEVEVELEVDLSSFLERQRLEDSPALVFDQEHQEDDDDDEVDHSLDQLTSNSGSTSRPQKGKVQQIVWDKDMEEMSREKAVADANRDLKTRLRANIQKNRIRSEPKGRSSKHSETRIEAPLLPTELPPPTKSQQENMQDFLDDLLG